MQKKYKGILIFVKIYNENDLFIKFLSNTDELISGIVYGGQSKRKRNIYQIGFYLNLNIIQKNKKPASIDAELCAPFVSNIVNDKYKLNCLICVASLINLSIIEGQIVKNIYKISDDFLNLMFVNKKWLRDYILFLFKLLKIIGYEVEFRDNKNKYFDLLNLEFCNHKSAKTIEFPLEFLINQKSKMNKNMINNTFKIFETVFVKNHLSIFNLKLPNQYHLFNKLIIDRINK